MSYCVNCGVELAPSEKNCPLCSVPVLNPVSPWQEPSVRPYPRQLEKIMRRIDRRYGATLATLLLFLPVVLAVISNMIIDRAITWSAYVVGAGVCLFFWGLFPLSLRKPKILLLVGIDVLVTLLYLGLINYMSGSSAWFWPLALPLTLIAGLLAFLVLFCHRTKQIRGLYKVAAVLVLLGAAAVAVEFILNRFNTGGFHLFWSWFVLIPCIILGIIFILLEKRQKLKDEILRRLFI